MAPDLWENETKIQEEGALTDLITDKSIAHRTSAAANGHFVDVAHNAPTGLISRRQANTRAPALQQRPEDDNTTTPTTRRWWKPSIESADPHADRLGVEQHDCDSRTITAGVDFE